MRQSRGQGVTATKAVCLAEGIQSCPQPMLYRTRDPFACLLVSAVTIAEAQRVCYENTRSAEPTVRSREIAVLPLGVLANTR